MENKVQGEWRVHYCKLKHWCIEPNALKVFAYQVNFRLPYVKIPPLTIPIAIICPHITLKRMRETVESRLVGVLDSISGADDSR